MANQEKKQPGFLNKLLSRYRMVIINEETFEEQVQVRVSRLNFMILVILIIGSISTATFITIAYTP
ncbi:MAG: M23 family peptidase, partial [Flavobacteriales bacterium]